MSKRHTQLMQFTATVTDLETGEVLERMGPFDSTKAARLVCGVKSGTLLRWERHDEHWEAHTGTRVYSVPRHIPLSEE